MSTNQDTYTQYAGDIAAGADVYDRNGDKIGSVASGGGMGGSQYFIVEKGLLFVTDLYVPLSAVERTEDDDIHLNLTKDEIEGRDWDQEPDESADFATTEAVDGYQRRAGAAVTEGDATLERREERLTVDKQPVQTGEVRVGKRVEAQQQSVDVPVTREQVSVERRSVDRPASGDAFEEEAISVPVSEERVIAGKETRVVEELDVDKVAVQDTERVDETVRREEFEIDADTNVRNR